MGGGSREARMLAGPRLPGHVNQARHAFDFGGEHRRAEPREPIKASALALGVGR